MNKEKILSIYQKEKDERLLINQRKALTKGYIATTILSIFLIFFSIELQDTPTVFYTIFILILPMASITYGMKGYIEKSRFYIVLALCWFFIFLFYGYRYMMILIG